MGKTVGIGHQDFEQMIRENNFYIDKTYNKNEHLLESDLLNKKEKEFYQEVSANMSDSTAAAALRSLSDYLYRYYGKKTIILLDAYDTPMQEAYVNGYWEEVKNGITDSDSANVRIFEGKAV